MIPALTDLLNRYDANQISRRELLIALAAVAAPVARAEAAPAVATVTQLNHVTVFVKDVPRATTFYQRLFDMPVLTPQDAGMNLKAGEGFLGLYPADDRPTGINHLCLGIRGFNPERVLDLLKREGLEANIRLRGDTKELYFTDPDGVRVQLQDVTYIGGTGPLGNRRP